jgi:hypothetical protein
LDDNPQNLIDPDNAFLYPLDYFVSGSEYATFFAGNTTNFAANVRPQNFQLVNVNFVYGLSDSVNFGLGYGFHSGSSLHHFTVFDMTSRFYRFKPYHFFDSLIDWRISKGSLLSFGAHFVPEYMTFMENSGYTKEFRSKTRYIDVSVSLKMLF